MAKKATAAAVNVPASITVEIAASADLMSQGLFVSKVDTPVPLPLGSLCFAIIVDVEAKTVANAFMSLRPTGMNQDVVAYAANDRNRASLTPIHQLNGAEVKVDVAADVESVLFFTQPELSIDLSRGLEGISQQIKAMQVGDDGSHVPDDALIEDDEEGVVADVDAGVSEEAEDESFVEEEVEEQEADAEDVDEEGEPDEEAEEGEEGGDEDDAEEKGEDEEYEYEEGDEEGDEYEEGDEEGDEYEYVEEGEEGDEEEEYEEDDEEYAQEDDEEYEEGEEEEYEEDDEEGEEEEGEDSIEDFIASLAELDLEKLRPIAQTSGVAKVRIGRCKKAADLRKLIIDRVRSGKGV